MDNSTERFVKEDEVKGLKMEGHDIHEKPIEVGQEFELAGRKFRVRKITSKDIICRPLTWNQEVEDGE